MSTRDGPPIIAVNATNTTDVYLYFGNGAGGFTGPKSVSLPVYQADRTGLAIGDVNGDGYPDLVSDGGYVACGEGGGNFTAPVSYKLPTARAIGLFGALNI